MESLVSVEKLLEGEELELAKVPVCLWCLYEAVANNRSKQRGEAFWDNCNRALTLSKPVEGTCSKRAGVVLGAAACTNPKKLTFGRPSQCCSERGMHGRTHSPLVASHKAGGSAAGTVQPPE